MSEKHHIIPVWFFVGFLLLVYGFLILVSGLAEWSHPSNTVLAEKHAPVRSEEHTSELQSLAYLVCRLLLEKKKKSRAVGSRERFWTTAAARACGAAVSM